jgi:hypothetical protein
MITGLVDSLIDTFIDRPSLRALRELRVDITI